MAFQLWYRENKDQFAGLGGGHAAMKAASALWKAMPQNEKTEWKMKFAEQEQKQLQVPVEAQKEKVGPPQKALTAFQLFVQQERDRETSSFTRESTQSPMSGPFTHTHSLRLGQLYCSTAVEIGKPVLLQAKALKVLCRVLSHTHSLRRGQLYCSTVVEIGKQTYSLWAGSGCRHLYKYVRIFTLYMN